jgi:hypothetical protein
MEYKKTTMSCLVARLDRPPKIESGWEVTPWTDISSVLIRNHMGPKPAHFPSAEVKIAYDDTALYVIFRVADQYVRAVAQAHQGHVWEDSCVEFFFTPDADVSKGYFNLEMNCGGTMLFHFHPGTGKERIVFSERECEMIQRGHSLPRIVDPEIRTPIIWTLAYCLPIDLLKAYFPVVKPGPNVQWRANFYKCADQTSHPHWLTWAPVDFAKPNFHVPEAFGVLKFE